MFRDKVAPEGFVFAACEPCNGGSSDDDLLAAFMGRIDPSCDELPKQVEGLTRLVIRQFPGFARSLVMSATQARQTARRFGIRPAPGELYQDLPLMHVTDEMEAAVRTLASKLTRAVHFQQTGQVFPLHGAIALHWFTNATVAEQGRNVALEVLGGLAGNELRLVRSGKDLSDQVRLRANYSAELGIAALTATFNESFGFVTFSSPDPTLVEGILQRGRERRAAAGRSTDLGFELLAAPNVEQ